MSDQNPLNTGPVVHAETMMEFPKERQAQMDAIAAQKAQATAHMPYKKGERPGNTPGRPMATPIAEIPPQQPPIHNQAGVSHNGKLPPNQGANQQQGNPTPGARALGDHPLANQQAQPFDWSSADQPRQQTRSVPASEDDQADEAVGENQVEVTMPGFSGGTADAQASSVALPSRFAFYAFKDLYVQPLRAKHLAKLQRAASEGSLLPVVEAVSSVIHTTTPGAQATAFDLTLPDFYFVLYWLRLHSFTKSNYLHTTICNAEEHRQRAFDFKNLAAYAEAVENGEMTAAEFQQRQATAVPEDTLKIEALIRNTDLKVIELTAVPDPEIFHFSDTSAMFLRPPTMRDTIEFTEHPSFRNKKTRAEFSYMSELAIHVQHREHLLSLDQRIAIVEEATTDQVTMIHDFKDLLSVYGVQEKITVQCKGCGAKRDSILSLDAHSFLSAR